MAEKVNENLDSKNETIDDQTSEENLETTEDVDALKEKNRQLFARAKKAETDLKEFKQSSKEKSADDKKPEPEKEKGFDYGELAKIILDTKGVHEDDHEWVIERSKELGKSVRDYLKSDGVQLELKERDEARSSDDAIPEGKKRSQGGAQAEDTVEYWVKLGKQPPVSKPLKFRKEVLDARKNKSKETNKFSSDSIVMPAFQEEE